MFANEHTIRVDEEITLNAINNKPTRLYPATTTFILFDNTDPGEEHRLFLTAPILRELADAAEAEEARWEAAAELPEPPVDPASLTETECCQ